MPGLEPIISCYLQGSTIGIVSLIMSVMYKGYNLQRFLKTCGQNMIKTLFTWLNIIYTK